MRDGDTIVALSSGALPSGVAIIRLSGPKAGTLLTDLTGKALPVPRQLTLASIRTGGEILDRGLVAWFPGPHSFTGEDCAELQLHGSRAVVRLLLRQVAAQSGVRLAEAGEFTRRAFENGRLDLTEVEGLGDLIEAETENQRRLAVSRLDGALSRQISAWRMTLLDLRAEIEARLDFSDESDVDIVLPERVRCDLSALRADLESARDSLDRGRIAREGLRVALAGPANAGKSSLLNALIRSDVAIVSDEPGTTRDVREVALDLGGQLVLLIDMAGLRETDSRAEAEGIARARREIAQADLVLWLVAPDVPATELPDLDDGAEVWRLDTKADLGASVSANALPVSALTGEGLDGLLAKLTEFVTERRLGEPLLLSRERDRQAIEAAMRALVEAEADIERLELAADSLRQAGDALARLTGELDAEMVLDRLFSAFCIGK
ncbi:MAG TPA: tRNA uridine-5-carboxymethylaminomethyl(34) synthesis GTPase MnmE [Devosiaceae bacterium]|nr:tRNA uridine-5-carboxymethylaminomethyl(34) synthesis GTPase MnmE [Devosiaceae bacterium]